MVAASVSQDLEAVMALRMLKDNGEAQRVVVLFNFS
jgi:hypothetical protein